MKYKRSKSSKKTLDLVGNTSQISPAKHWVFTLNNHRVEDIEWLKNHSSIFTDLIFQVEKGECGTPHLQGYFAFIEKSRPFNVFDNKNYHFEKCDNIKASRAYAQKLETRFEGPWLYKNGKEWYPFQLKCINPTLPWQVEIIKVISRLPDDRRIHWYWSKLGGIGKTQFCKYLSVAYGAICLCGKGADVRNGVLNYIQKNGRYPEIVLYNIPRSVSSDFISWEAIENVKDMYFFSGKYEGGQVNGPSPHVVVFANYPMPPGVVSKDRYVVERLDEPDDEDICYHCQEGERKCDKHFTIQDYLDENRDDPFII